MNERFFFSESRAEDLYHLQTSHFKTYVLNYVPASTIGKRQGGKKTKIRTRKCGKSKWIKEKSGILRLPIFGLSDKTWTCGLYHPNGVRLVCKSANIVEYLPISLIFRGFRLLFGKYRLLKKCTRCRKNTILYQNFVPDFSAFQGFCGFCLKGLYHIFLKKSSAESYLFEN